MDSLIFAINAVAPLIFLVALGYFLKRIGWVTLGDSKTLNRLVFHIFLPATLFLNIYKIESFGDIEFGYIVYAMAAVGVLYLLAIGAIVLLVRDRSRWGALLQSAFRSNYALVGIPLAGSLFGDEGVIAASLLSAVIVPSLNMLAVVSLTVFGSGKASIKKVLIGIAKNPLIRAIFLGLAAIFIRSLFVKGGISFRLSEVKSIYTTLTYMSNLSTPLALVALGAQFEFSTVTSMKKEIIMGILMRTVVSPVLGIGVAYVFFRDVFTGAHFATFVAVFVTPVAVSSVPMTQEMKGDVVLMGQLVVWTTLLSSISIFIASFLLRLAGIF